MAGKWRANGGQILPLPPMEPSKRAFLGSARVAPPRIFTGMGSGGDAFRDAGIPPQGCAGRRSLRSLRNQQLSDSGLRFAQELTPSRSCCCSCRHPRSATQHPGRSGAVSTRSTTGNAAVHTEALTTCAASTRSTQATDLHPYPSDSRVLRTALLRVPLRSSPSDRLRRPSYRSRLRAAGAARSACREVQDHHPSLPLTPTRRCFTRAVKPGSRHLCAKEKRTLFVVFFLSVNELRGATKRGTATRCGIAPARRPGGRHGATGGLNQRRLASKRLRTELTSLTSCRERIF